MKKSDAGSAKTPIKQAKELSAVTPKSVKKPTNRGPKPAHSGVPVPAGMRNLILSRRVIQSDAN